MNKSFFYILFFIVSGAIFFELESSGNLSEDALSVVLSNYQPESSLDNEDKFNNSRKRSSDQDSDQGLDQFKKARNSRDQETQTDQSFGKSSILLQKENLQKKVAELKANEIVLQNLLKKSNEEKKEILENSYSVQQNLIKKEKLVNKIALLTTKLFNKERECEDTEQKLESALNTAKKQSTIIANLYEENKKLQEKLASIQSLLKK